MRKNPELNRAVTASAARERWAFASAQAISKISGTRTSSGTPANQLGIGTGWYVPFFLGTKAIASGKVCALTLGLTLGREIPRSAITI